jgi:hypothetical protein
MGWMAVEPGSAIRRWAMAAPDERLYPGTARPMPDGVDYRFVNGWTATGELPCREALRAALPGRRVARPQGPFDDLVLGLDGAELDFSRFCYRPTLIARGFRCLIRGRGVARFRIATCGGVRLWLGDEEVAVFEPFTRNQPQAREVTLDLPELPAALTLRLEDLHERDTTCFFSLTLLAGRGVAAALPAGFETDEVDGIAAAMASLRTERLFHEAGPVRLVADVPPSRSLRIAIANLAPFSRGGLVADPDAAAPVDVVITPDQPAATLVDAAEAPPGCLSLRLEAKVAKARIVRQLGTTVLPPGHALSGDLADRKRQAADHIAHFNGFEPSVAALLAARGEQPERVAAIVRAVLVTIEERHDCSDFSILPLLRLWQESREVLDPALRKRLCHAFLGYRYWLDEPGDDVMWFWSENHVLCFHTAQLIAGRLFPDAVFANSGKTGREHADQAAERLDRWFASIERHGLCEWNSAAYYPIDMLGLFTLHDMAPDFRSRAEAVLDRVFVMAALHSSGGVPAGTQGRCYEKELLAGPMTELGSVMAIALGGPFRPGYDRATALFCLSDYAPPPLGDLAAPASGSWLEARYTQGLEHEGKLVLWKSADAQLSTVAELKTGQRGHQAQVLDVQLAQHPMARLWINHPGELKPWGERRPSLLAGNHVMPRVAQAGPAALMIYDLDRPWTDLHLTQLFAASEAFGQPMQVGEWLVFAEAVGVWCSTQLAMVTAGLYRDALWRAAGLRMGWVVALRLPDEDPSAFRGRLAGAELAFDEAGLGLVVAGLGPLPLALRFDGPFLVGGAATSFAPLSPVPHVARDGGPLTPWDGRRPPR